MMVFTFYFSVQTFSGSRVVPTLTRYPSKDEYFFEAFFEEILFIFLSHNPKTKTQKSKLLQSLQTI